MVERLDKCLLCSSPNLIKDTYAIEHLNLAHPHGVSRCLDCGLRFLNPRPTKDDYNQLYAHNDGTIIGMYPNIERFYANEDAAKLFEYENKLNYLTKLRKKGKILEIGSCTGIFLNIAQEYGFDVEGIEPNIKYCEKAKEIYGLELKNGNIEDQQFPPESFDILFSSHVFEHLLYPLEVVHLLYNWLRPGGFLLIEVPNQFESFAAKRKKVFYPHFPVKRSVLSIHHTIFFSKKTLVKLIETNGMTVSHVRDVYYYAPISVFKYPIRFIAKILNPLFGGSGVIEILAQKSDNLSN